MADPRSFQMGRIKKSQGFETNWLTAFLQGHAFVSTQNGSWADPATWGNFGVPSKLVDTVVIAGHTVTVPNDGTDHIVGAVTLNNGSTLNINGTLSIFGDMTIPNNCTLNGSAGGFFNLNGRGVRFTGTGNVMNFAGTAKGSTATTFNIRGGSGRGFFNVGFPNTVNTSWNFVDCRGLSDSIIGRTGSPLVAVQKVTNSYFEDMQGLTLDENGGTNVDVGFQFNNNDIRNMNALSAGKDFPFIRQANQILGINPREIIGNTYDGIINASPLRITLNNVKSVTEHDNIYGGVQWNSNAESVVFSNDFFYNLSPPNLTGGSGTVFNVLGSLVKSITGCYFYYTGGDHGFASLSSQAGDYSIGTNIFESGATPPNGSGINWFLNTIGSGTFTNNILIGNAGNLICYTNNANLGATGLTVSGNTAYIDNYNTGSAVDRFPIWFSGEQVGFAPVGTVNVYNNIHYDIDLGATLQEFIVANASGNAYTINRVSNNEAWPAAVRIDATNLTVTNSGGNVNVDPLFADKTRCLAKWDLSLGGPGTAANAIAEMLKVNGTGGVFNPAYSITALKAYVRAGFQPTGAGLAALTGTGFGAVDIGAR